MHRRRLVADGLRQCLRRLTILEEPFPGTALVVERSLSTARGPLLTGSVRGLRHGVGIVDVGMRRRISHTVQSRDSSTTPAAAQEELGAQGVTGEVPPGPPTETEVGETPVGELSEGARARLAGLDFKLPDGSNGRDEQNAECALDAANGTQYTMSLEELLNAPPPYIEALQRTDLATIYLAFQHLRGRTNSFMKILTFLEYVLTARPTRLRRYHYNLVIEAMSHPKGSAKVIRTLLSEIKALEIVPSQLLWHNCLAALAIHPDYILRNSVFASMRAQWIEPTTLDRIYEAIGLLRDTQYELALDKLEDLIATGTFIAPWIFEVFSVVFANLNFLDEAHRLVYHRLKPSTHAPSGDFFLHMLTLFADGFHYEGTKLMWYHTTRAMDVHPPDAVVQSVIHTAARYGDPTLALEAMDILALRGTQLGITQFEPLLDCYAAIGDMATAARVISVMFRSRLDIRRGSTRALFTTLRENPELTDTLANHLKTCNRQVPISVVNVLLEARHAHSDLSGCLSLYKSIGDFTDKPATSETFGYLIDLAEDPQTLLFLADEAATIVPDLRIRTSLLHKLAHACVTTSNRDLALRYFFRVNDEWRRSAPKDQMTIMREAYRLTYSAVFRLLLKHRDHRCVDVLFAGHARMQRLGAGLRRELDMTWPEVWEIRVDERAGQALSAQGTAMAVEESLKGPEVEELKRLKEGLEGKDEDGEVEEAGMEKPARKQRPVIF